MKFSAILAFAFAATASAFTPAMHAAITTPRAMPMRQALPDSMEEVTVDVQDKAAKMLPAVAALTLATAAHAEGMTAAYLPAILTPIVGLAFPGASMALWFIYVSKDQD
jgi:photosystem I reaction center subunit VIII